MNPTDIRRAKTIRCRICNKHKQEIKPFPASLQLVDYAITKLKVHLVERHIMSPHPEMEDEQSSKLQAMFLTNWAQYYEVAEFHKVEAKLKGVNILELSP